MKKVLIVYFSHSGETEKVADYIAEGVRFTGNQALIRKMSEVGSAEDLKGYDGYIFGSPTYSSDLPAPVKTFLSLTGKTDLEGKMAGSFGSYRHEVGHEPGGKAAGILFDTMQEQFKMTPFELGPLVLKEDQIESDEGLRASQAYGRVFGEKLGQ